MRYGRTNVLLLVPHRFLTEQTMQITFLLRETRGKSFLDPRPVFRGQGYGRAGEGASLCGAGERLPGIFQIIVFPNSLVIDNRLCEESPAQPE